MNISNIILQLVNLANQSSDAFTLMLLAKSIEKLKVGAVTVVGSTAQLPSSATSNIGEIYLISGDDELYANDGTRWVSLISEQVDLATGWGRNYKSQLGDSTTTDRSNPVIVVGGITNWAQVSAGKYNGNFAHSLGVTADGIAYGWGEGGVGQLGDGTTFGSSSPVSVIGGITNWAQGSAGVRHSLGVTASGIAYGWGYGGNGNLGDDTTTSRSSPVSVVGGITNWAQVSAGGQHSLGVNIA
jgi:alpha-tubulin suppressor-like RCC1 family protein